MWNPATDEVMIGCPVMVYCRHPEATAFIRLVCMQYPDGKWFTVGFTEPTEVIVKYWQPLPGWPSSKVRDDAELWDGA